MFQGCVISDNISDYGPSRHVRSLLELASGACSLPACLSAGAGTKE